MYFDYKYSFAFDILLFTNITPFFFASEIKILFGKISIPIINILNKAFQNHIGIYRVVVDFYTANKKCAGKNNLYSH